MENHETSDAIELLHLRIVSDFAIDMLSIVSTEQVLWHQIRNVVARLSFPDVVIISTTNSALHLVAKALTSMRF